MSSSGPARRSRVGSTLLVLWLLASIALSSACAMKAAARTGRQAPDFELVDINPGSSRFGQTVVLHELYQERGLVLHFTASWCEYCRAELGEIQRLHAGGKPIVLMAADEGTDRESMRILAERHGLTVPILFVPESSVEKIERQYAYEVLPATYVIDRAGKILSVHEGALPDGRLAQTIESHLR